MRKYNDNEKENKESENSKAQTRVVHCKKESYDVYIGRPSKWGNPFTIGVDGTREEVIKKYLHYVVENRHLMNSLDEIRGKTLGCWCKPKACHGDILVKLCDGHAITL